MKQAARRSRAGLLAAIGIKPRPAPTCPYCGKPSVWVVGRHLYPQHEEFRTKSFWRCHACDAHVGCHRKGSYVTDEDGRRIYSDGTLPLGALANGPLRRARRVAHSLFDRLHNSGRMSRDEAYEWLSAAMILPRRATHIAMFDLPQCRRAIDLIQQHHPA